MSSGRFARFVFLFYASSFTSNLFLLLNCFLWGPGVAPSAVVKKYVAMDTIGVDYNAVGAVAVRRTTYLYCHVNAIVSVVALNAVAVSGLMLLYFRVFLL